MMGEFYCTKTFRFQPPDASYVELLRFRVRPPRARELPMQARCQFIITGNRVCEELLIPFLN